MSDDPALDSEPVVALPPESPAPAPVEPTAYQPDVVALNAAGGDPAIWGRELHHFVESGAHLSEESVASWFSTFADQVTRATFRSALFQVANTPLPANAAGDRSILLLELRDEIARSFKHAAGL